MSIGWETVPIAYSRYRYLTENNQKSYLTPIYVGSLREIVYGFLLICNLNWYFILCSSSEVSSEYYNLKA